VAEPFARYDSRGYRMLDVAEGYAAWAPFYDATMDDRLDLLLLSPLHALDWTGTRAAVDLGCGTGRVGAWLGTRLAAGSYDLAISSFVVCHVTDLAALYAEAARLIRPCGRVILIDYHPFMLLKGVPTHFVGATGEPIAIANVVHLLGDHVEIGQRAGLSLVELREQLVDAEWVGQNPRMANHAGQPVSFGTVWARE
jgi:methyltransferase family protein